MKSFEQIIEVELIKDPEGSPVVDKNNNSLKKDYPSFQFLLKNISKYVGSHHQVADSFKKFIEDHYSNPIEVAEHIIINSQDFKKAFSKKHNDLYLAAENIIKEEIKNNDYFSLAYFKKTQNHPGSFIEIKKYILGSKNPGKLIEEISEVTRSKKFILKSLVNNSNKNVFDGLSETKFQLYLRSELLTEFNDENSEKTWEEKVSLYKNILDKRSAEETLTIYGLFQQQHPLKNELSWAYTAAKEYLRDPKL